MTSSPRRCGRYVLRERLSGGAISAVYVAHSDDAPEPVVLKMIPEEHITTPGYVVRFQREIEIARRLDHANIVRAVDASNDLPQPFLALEYIPGVSLADVVYDIAKLPHDVAIPWSVSVTLRILEALQYAHERSEVGKPLSIVHRDMAPKNVMIALDGTVKVIDFGVARAEVDDFRTATGALIGTPRYMSPEQVEHGRPDLRTDLYSTGVILWELLAGRGLVQATEIVEVIGEIAMKAPPPIRDVNPNVPESLAGVVMKSLAKNAEERFDSAAAMASALRGAVAHDFDVERIRQALLRSNEPAMEAARVRWDRHRGASTAPAPNDTRVVQSSAQDGSDVAAMYSNTVTAVPRPASMAAPPAQRNSRTPILVAIAAGLTIAAVVFVIGMRAQPDRPAPATVAAPPTPTPTPEPAPGVVARTPPPLPTRPPPKTRAPVRPAKNQVVTAPPAAPPPSAPPPDPYAKLRRSIHSLDESAPLAEQRRLAAQLRAAAKRTNDADRVRAVDRELERIELGGGTAALRDAFRALTR